MNLKNKTNSTRKSGRKKIERRVKKEKIVIYIVFSLLTEEIVEVSHECRSKVLTILHRS